MIPSFLLFFPDLHGHPPEKRLLGQAEKAPGQGALAFSSDLGPLAVAGHLQARALGHGDLARVGMRNHGSHGIPNLFDFL